MAARQAALRYREPWLYDRKRPTGAKRGRSSRGPQVDALGQGQCIFDVDAEPACRAVPFRETRHQPDRAQGPGILVDLCDRYPSQGMGPVGARIETRDITTQPRTIRASCGADRGRLPWTRPGQRKSRPEISGSPIQRPGNSRAVSATANRTGLPVLLWMIEGRSVFRSAAKASRSRIATAQLAVDGHVEQREVARLAGPVEPDPDGPDAPPVLRLARPGECDWACHCAASPHSVAQCC